MKSKAYIKPSRPALIVGLIAVILMLIFGIFFMRVLMNEESGIGTGFISIWMLFLLLIGGVFVYNLSNKNDEKSIADEITFTHHPTQEEKEHDFDTKLRKLEMLRKDELINDQEYSKKRAEILNSKW
jgi:amino acid permease